MNKFNKNIGIVAVLLLVSLCGSAAQGQNASHGDSGVRNGADPQKLIAVLQKADASEFDKARACQQLSIIGTKDAAEALAPLLGDAHLNSYARSGLESIKDPIADKILRDAMGKLQGKLLVGVINSIGVRRDAEAVSSLCKLASDRDAELASAAMAALGRIATPEACDVLLKSLTSAPAELRPAAADACLVCAERQSSMGKHDTAQAFFDAVRRADVPRHLRIAATCGAIIQRKSEGLSLLVENLKSDDLAFVGVALFAARALPNAEITTALASEIKSARPAVKVMILQALEDRNGPAALAAIEAALASDAPEVRLAALTALGKAGGASSIALLLKAMESASKTESAAAAASLCQLSAKETDAAILHAITAASSPLRVQLITILGGRNATIAADALLLEAASADADVSKAALTALWGLSRAGDLPELVRLATKGNDAIRQTAERAVFFTCMKIPEASHRTDVLVAAMKESKDSAARCSLIRMLRGVGDQKAFEQIQALLADTDPQVQGTAIRSLADWPDATPTAALLQVVKNTKDPLARTLALRGAIRLAGAAAADSSRSAEQVLAWLKQANEDVKKTDADEKRLILSGMGNLKSIEGFQLVQEYLNDPSVELEATVAAIQIAKQLTGDAQRTARAAMEKAAGKTKNAAVSKRLKAAIP